MTVESARGLAKDMLSDERFHHTECVAASAVKLARSHAEDIQKAGVAGYLHDIAKEFDKSDLLQMIERSDIIDVDEIRHCAPVWHAYGGGIYAKETLGVDDDISGAVMCHTTGRAGMTKLEKIIFLADYISEDRDFGDMDDIRILAYEKLDLAVLMVIERQITHLVKHERYIDINMIRAYNDFLLTVAPTGEK